MKLTPKLSLSPFAYRNTLDALGNVLGAPVLLGVVLSMATAGFTSDAFARSKKKPKPIQVLQGKVVKVSDGDTVTILKDSEQTKIRLLGIDAPEKSMPFGRVCTQKLADKIAGKEVMVQVVETDRYKRSLGKILLDGRDINLAQVAEGCAWHYKRYQRSQASEDRALYAAKEVEARQKKLGLWADPLPVAPWAHRSHHQKRRRE